LSPRKFDYHERRKKINAPYYIIMMMDDVEGVWNLPSPVQWRAHVREIPAASADNSVAGTGNAADNASFAYWLIPSAYNGM
jgi:hypothetical protein